MSRIMKHFGFLGFVIACCVTYSNAEPPAGCKNINGSVEDCNNCLKNSTFLKCESTFLCCQAKNVPVVNCTSVDQCDALTSTTTSTTTFSPITTSSSTVTTTSSTTTSPATTTSSTTSGATTGSPQTTTPPSSSSASTTSPSLQPTVVPVHYERCFDALSFIGGIILTVGLLAIFYVGFKFYKARTERNYHTL